MFRWRRFLAMAIKELQVVLLDKRSRMTLLGSPILQLALFGLATTLDVTNVDLGMVNRDSGVVSERLLAGLEGSPNIRKLVVYPSNAALLDAIERREVIAGIVLPQDLSNDVAAARPGQVGLLLDGRRINSAQIVAGYINEIVRQTGGQLKPETVWAGPQIVASNRFNPNLLYHWFTMPALIALITTVVSLSVSMQSVARERELGTMDELMILPLNRAEIILGKLAPGFLVALFNVLVFLVLIPLLYGVPLNGSILALLAATFCFGLSIAGIGLSVSTVTQNQQQAFLAGFLIIVPMIMISGYVTPYDNMPPWLQIAAKADPLYHMLIICQGTFLKAISLESVFSHTWPMLAVAFFTLGIAAVLFRIRVE